MNRLIIIGNGFDLAHGLKTSATDFILNYFKDSINNFYSFDEHADLLLDIKFDGGYYTTFGKNRPKLITAEDVLKEIPRINRIDNYSLKLHSPLLNRIMSKIKNLFWVDIEMEYFNVLSEIRIEHRKSDPISAVKDVNEKLNFLKTELIKYLILQQDEYKQSSISEPLIECFCEPVKHKEIVTIEVKKEGPPKNLYILNFNYTNTVDEYLMACKAIIPSRINYIHGNLSGEYGEPIFGFGDEIDKRYLEFEDDQNNELFKHIKSFEYLKTKNFYNLTRFLDSEPYQVHIYGHSCGLSDRTLLSQIFEHDYCKSIKIFYHRINENENDFTEKTYEIARHFKDKIMLRKKLVPFELSREMPQPKMI